jgi:cell wall-associated NlpC family hydrolase
MLPVVMWKRFLFAATVMLLSSAAFAKSYTVQSGDTLYRVAQKNGISLTRLLQLNPGISENIKPGQKINVDGNAVTTSKAAPAKKPVLSSSSNRSSTVVRVAFSQVGSRYVWGASRPGAFDCSGFTSYVMRQMGVTLPRTSRAQFNVGRAVTRSGLLPGDLVFFRGPSGGGVGHVGVYVGNNKMVHASTPRTGVIVSSLGERYYSSRYLGARRVLK